MQNTLFEAPEYEKDCRRMQELYPRDARQIQSLVDRECDRMEYDGSMMFDEYPDKFMMEHLCRKIEQEVLKEEEGNTSVLIIEETCQGGQGSCGNRREEEGLRDLIGVILFNEMFRRRSRHRRQKRFYYQNFNTNIKFGCCGLQGKPLE